MNQLRLCSRWRALTTQSASLSRHSSHALETGNGFRDLPRGGHSG